MSALQSALDMAERGHAVFPIIPGTKVPYSVDDIPKIYPATFRPLCGSTNIATRNPDKIRRWFEIEPNLNYGVKADNFVILDVDMKNKKPGLDDLLSLGTLPPTFTVSTPTGGLHLYFECGEAVSQSPLSKGIDIRSGMGYVVGPGSEINGVSYKIALNAKPAMIPEFLYERVKKGASTNPEKVTPLTELDRPMAVEAGKELLHRHPGTMTGGRNSEGFVLACQLKDLGLSSEMIGNLLLEVWNPKNEEPLYEAEIRTLAENAFKSGRYAPGIKNPDEEFEDIPELLADIQLVTKPEPELLFDRIIQGRDPHDIPARPWLVPGLLIRSSLTTIVAQPGAKKSTFTIGIAAGFALGSLKHMGFDLRCGPTDVMLINNEDDEDEIDRRLYACCKLNGLDYHEAKAKLHLFKPGDGRAFVAVGRNAKTGNVGVSEMFKQLRGYAKLHNIGLIIFDPLADMHVLNENDNSEMAQMMSYIRGLVRDVQASGLVIHHSRKPDIASSHSYAGDPFSSRGASAIHGNVRVLATLCAASEEDGYKLGISPPNHLNYSRFDLGKGSYSPPGKHTRWYVCEAQRVGPIDYDDTAPALKIAEYKDQPQRRIEAMHAAIRANSALFDKEGEMDGMEAAKIIADSMPGIALDDALGYLKALFIEPQSIEGVILTLIQRGRKWILVAH